MYSLYFISNLPEGVGTTTTFLGVMATCGGSEGVAEVVVELTTVATVGTARENRKIFTILFWSNICNSISTISNLLFRNAFEP